MDQQGLYPEDDKELNGSAGPSSRGRQGTEWISWAFIQKKKRNRKDQLGHHPEKEKEPNGSAGPSSRGRQRN